MVLLAQSHPLATNWVSPCYFYKPQPAKASIADINSLVGNKLPVEIPQVAVKWLTYALFLHVVALILSAGSALFGLLAHVREMSMTCCSTCISGFAASVAMIAFIFDLALFFVAKARINAIGSAQIGSAIWLTLAAWILLFFSGCFYTLGRCCLSGRGPRGDKRDWGRKDPEAVPSPSNGYAEQMRLDAVKAEADRKARQKAAEGGLPAFYETQPLTGRVEGDHVYIDDDSAPAPSSPGGRPGQGGHYPAGGYVPGQPGSRTVDDYYNTSHPNTSGSTTTYPPQPNQPHRQNSTNTGYAPSSYGNISTASSPPPHQPHRQASGYNVNAGYGQNSTTHAPSLTSSPPPIQQYSTPPHQYNTDPYANSGYDYGHTAGGTSCEQTPLLHLTFFRLKRLQITRRPRMASSSHRATLSMTLTTLNRREITFHLPSILKPTITQVKWLIRLRDTHRHRIHIMGLPRLHTTNPSAAIHWAEMATAPAPCHR